MYILADIGATKTRIAGSRDAESFAEPVIFHSPQDDEEFLSTFANTVASIAQGESVERIVIGKPHWHRKPSFESDLQARLPALVHFENDTALVGLGEALHGAGKGAAICVYITVSTGVNGVRIVDGVLDRSRQGFEIGGQYLSVGDMPQTLEDLVAGRNICARFNVSSPRDLGKEHVVWEELARTLSFGIHNTILHWSPDRVVIGGSMMNEIGISVERVGAHVQEIMKKFPEVPEIVHSSLGDIGGLWGGLALLRPSSA
jgi:predicted NBD/HSP70 family sugar kinase